MREKYLNLSGFEIDAMTPAEMLNITYEYNRKRALMQAMMFDKRKDDDLGPKPSESHSLSNSSSSSRSQQNVAQFNIFEELHYDQSQKNFNKDKGRGRGERNKSQKEKKGDRADKDKGKNIFEKSGQEQSSNSAQSA